MSARRRLLLRHSDEIVRPVARTRTTCILRAYLEANQRKPEERAVALLAAAMRTNRNLAQRMLACVQAEDPPASAAIVVGTEEMTFSGTDHIDLEIVVEDARRTLSRVWVEAKLDARLARGDKHQLVRYYEALHALDRRQASPPSKRLAVLVRRRSDLRPADLTAIRQTGAAVVLWQEVADAAWLIGEEDGGGSEWRLRARHASAPTSIAVLDSLLWYLQKRDSRVNAEPPLTPEAIHHYEHAVQVGKWVTGIARLVSAELARRKWVVELDRPSSEEPLTFASKPIKLPRPMPWWDRAGPRRADLHFQISPYDPRNQQTVAHVWAGVGFRKPVQIGTSWAAALTGAGFDPEEEEGGSGLIDWVGGFEALAPLVASEPTAGSQASRIADWIEDRVNELRRLGPEVDKPRPA